jgi:hypothetical protein
LISLAVNRLPQSVRLVQLAQVEAQLAQLELLVKPEQRVLEPLARLV